MTKWSKADIPSQQGKLSVVTGANSGLGWQTSLELARAGGEVILAVRNEEKGQGAVERILSIVPHAKVKFELIDLASLNSVRAFATRIDDGRGLDLLVNDAGVMSVPTRRTTQDGFELQFGTNFLGPFALTALLVPYLQRSASPRVTTVSSGAANMGLRRINFDDMQWERSYKPWKAYCQSKLADLMFALELGRRSTNARPQILSNAAHPGYARTNLQTSGPGRPQGFLAKSIAPIISQDAAQGALPIIRAATSLDTKSGDYFGPGRMFGLKGNPVLVRIPRPAQDETSARRLWEEAERLTGVQFALQEKIAPP
jgi:NAD(P)-dependent dehydrogenase (short-subunit alcohol dehydrogenase family)